MAVAIAIATAFAVVPVTGSVTASAANNAGGPVQMEFLSRGTVAVDTGSSVYLSWRLLGTEAYDTTFDVYKNGTKIETVADTTNYTDERGSADDTYAVIPSGAELTNSITFDGNEVTAVANASGLKAIAASYDGDKLKNIAIKKLTPGTTTFETDFEVEKAFLWDGMTPVGDAQGIDIDAETVKVWEGNALTIPIDKPEAYTDGSNYITYSANDAAVADLDGDGEYEIILKWDPSEAFDSGLEHEGPSGKVLIDAYKLNGTKMWRIDLGMNISAGAHFTQIAAYDFDLDGKAEIAFKTAPGSVDGKGNFVSAASLDNTIRSTNNNADYRQDDGRVMSGPEYYTVFDGETGAALDTIYYPYPRSDGDAWWGDPNKGHWNRSERFLTTAAYLDGVTPSIIAWRGYYNKTTVAAYNLVDKRLVQMCSFYTNNDTNYAGQGNHNTTVGDVDGDGRDEVICGAICLGYENGKLDVEWCSKRGHGDALHLADYDPTHPGMEYFSVHEGGGGTISGSTNGNDGKVTDFGMTVYDAADGTELGHWGASKDTGRGMMADVGAGGYYQMNAGNQVSAKIANGGTSFTDSDSSFSNNFRIFWDGDTYDELLDGTTITNWQEISNRWGTYWGMGTLFTANGCVAVNGTKANPSIQADILGDWREEVVYPNSDSTALVLYTTTIPTEHKLYTLMHDRAYRMQVVGQNSAYNQPPHISYYICEDANDPYDYRRNAAYIKTVHDGVTKQREDNSVTVKINFLDGEGNEIKESETVNSITDVTYIAPDKYLADFGLDANGMSWRYVSGNDGLYTGEEMGATKELNLVFERVQTHIPFGVNAVADGKVVKTLYRGLQKIGEETAVTRYGDYGIIGDDGKYYVLSNTSQNSATFTPSKAAPSASIAYTAVSGSGAELDFEDGDVSAVEEISNISVSAENVSGSTVAALVADNSNNKKIEGLARAHINLARYIGNNRKITVSYDINLNNDISSKRVLVSLLNADITSVEEEGWFQMGIKNKGGTAFFINNEKKNDYVDRWLRATFDINLNSGAISWVVTDRETGQAVSRSSGAVSRGFNTLKTLTFVSWTQYASAYLDNLSVVAYN